VKAGLKKGESQVYEVKPVKERIFVTAVVCITVLSHYYLKYFYAYIIFGKAGYNKLHVWQQTILVQSLGLILCFIMVGVISSFSMRKAKEMLGLDKDIVKPFIYVSMATLPSFVGYAILNGYAHPDLFDIAWYSLWPGFNEELVYRAFIVGILVRYANWNFFIAALLSGFVFASGHLYQAADFLDGVIIFTFASGAGIGFSFLYKYWNWYIWFTIFLHTFMNLAWVLFVFRGTALMNGTENIFRFTTLALAVAFTIYQFIQSKRANGLTEVKTD